MKPELIGAMLAGALALLIGAPASANEQRSKPAGSAQAQPGSQTQQAAAPTPDQAFLAARRAYLKRDARALETSAGQARTHLLADYIDYWRLNLKLRGPAGTVAETDREIERMLERHAGSIPADFLRRDWLNHLATRADWRRFDQHYVHLIQGPDAGLRCQKALSTLAQQATVAPDVIESLLMVPRALPDACQRLADQLQQAGKLSTQDVERRLLRAIESGSRPAIRQAAAAVGMAPSELDRALSTGGSLPADAPQFSRLATLIQLSLLARNDPALAAAALGRAAGPLRTADREFLWSQIAAAGMARLAPESLAWTRQGLRTAASDETLAWMARAALRERDWLLVGQIIERMSPAARQDPTWTYWAARALSEKGQKDESERMLARIAPGFDFYGLLAAEDLGRSIRVPAPPSRPIEAAEIETAGKNRGLHRALRLYQLGLRLDGNREWSHAIRSLNDRQLLATAAWACQRGVHDRCVNTAELTRKEHDFTLRFVTPFRDYVKHSSAERGLDPAWVYGLIRQESRFIADIRSSAGAQGLMQIMPATGKWIAGKLEQRNFRIEHLHEARTNIRFGTFYLRNVLDGLDGSPVLASAGYNAGPGRPQRWRETLATPVEGEIFAEIIPFNETRDYVKKVLSNATLYAAVLSGQPQSLRAWLGQVGPRAPLGSGPP